ncbi:MAG: tryptophan--tRNA ligase [Bacteroidia bacterium]
MDRVVSGIRSTGNLHLGNYFGAVKNFLKMQHEHECYFFVADYHTLTTHPVQENLAANERQVIIEYLACGLDPEKCTLYLQSDIPQTAELYLFLNMFAYKGELERVTTFKEKARKHPDNVNAGLLTYPCLMAADVLIHHGTKVPVGKDQEQHLEMMRTFGNRFNRIYNVDYFPEPLAFNFGTELVKVPGLDGSGKMGKSEGEGNAVFLCDDAATIRKRVMRAVTDSGPTQLNQEKPDAIKNIFKLMSIVSNVETLQHFEDNYNNMTIRYGDMKKQLAEDMVNFISPISEKIKELSTNHDYISKVIKMGKEKASASADKTIKEVREIIGFKES